MTFSRHIQNPLLHQLLQPCIPTRRRHNLAQPPQDLILRRAVVLHVLVARVRKDMDPDIFNLVVLVFVWYLQIGEDAAVDEAECETIGVGVCLDACCGGKLSTLYCMYTTCAGREAYNRRGTLPCAPCCLRTCLGMWICAGGMR